MKLYRIVSLIIAILLSIVIYLMQEDDSKNNNEKSMNPRELIQEHIEPEDTTVNKSM